MKIKFSIVGYFDNCFVYCSIVMLFSICEDFPKVPQEKFKHAHMKLKHINFNEHETTMMRFSAFLYRIFMEMLIRDML